jgi:uncharacterized membrane protein
MTESGHRASVSLDWVTSWKSVLLPHAAVVLGYTVSSAVLIFAAFLHDPKLVRRFDRRGSLWFAAVGLCNGLSVLSLYAALSRGPVALVAPLVASYPLVTLLLSFAFLKH